MRDPDADHAADAGVLRQTKDRRRYRRAVAAGVSAAAAADAATAGVVLFGSKFDYDRGGLAMVALLVYDHFERVVG